MHCNRHSLSFLSIVALVVAASVAGPPALADFEERKSFSDDSLVVRNLIGEVTVKGHSGSDFEVRVQVQGRDASRETIEIQTGTGELSVIFPIDRERDYVYPRLGSGSRTNFSMSRDDSGWLGALFDGLRNRRITVRGSGSGMQVWADVEVLVPNGKSLEFYLGVGEIDASDVSGDLRLDGHSGNMTAARIRGDLVVDTGSGGVTVTDVDGDLLVDTGSGGVEVVRASGRSVSVDTGSGRVRVEEIDTGKLNVDTGSGSVKALNVRADRAIIDTGSGSVTLELDRMGDGDFSIDTGSGHVELLIPADASADVRAETGSGGIDIDLEEGVTLSRHDDDEVSFRLGGGAARVRLDTGSGGIRIGRAR